MKEEYQSSQNTQTPSPITPELSAPVSDLPLGGQPLEPWHEPVDGALLLDDLVATVCRHIILPKWAPQAFALWDLHTFAYHLRDVTTYLGIESPDKRCGKSTLLAFASKVVNRPVVASNVSSSAAFHVIHEAKPTFIIDEADTHLVHNEELRGILNSGYTRDTAYVVRMGNQPASAANSHGQAADPNGKLSQLACFSSWCPKIIASIGRLPDTLADRCIIIRMQRKTPVEKCERLRNLKPATLKRRCLRFVQDHAAEIAAAQPAAPAELNDRAADIWEPLFALADIAGRQWPTLARQAAVALTLGAQETNPVASLLLDILLAFSSKSAERLFTRDILAFLFNVGDRPWADLRKSKSINELWLAHILRPYGVRPKTLWLDGARAKGYVLEDFDDIFRRYIPRSEVESLRAELHPEVGTPSTASPDNPPVGTPSTASPENAVVQEPRS